MELKPCPFCGGKAEIIEYNVGPVDNDNDSEWNRYRLCFVKLRLRCECGIENRNWATRLDAERWWNHRQEEKPCLDHSDKGEKMICLKCNEAEYKNIEVSKCPKCGNVVYTHEQSLKLDAIRRELKPTSAERRTGKLIDEITGKLKP